MSELLSKVKEIKNSICPYNPCPYNKGKLCCKHCDEQSTCNMVCTDKIIKSENLHCQYSNKEDEIIWSC